MFTKELVAFKGLAIPNVPGRNKKRFMIVSDRMKGSLLSHW
jgi:hypothetical protein